MESGGRLSNCAMRVMFAADSDGVEQHEFVPQCGARKKR